MLIIIIFAILNFIVMKRFYFAIILLSLFFVGCKPEVENPTVVTQEVTDVTTNTAKIIYNIVDDGGAEVTSRGVCWDTIQNPTIDDNNTNEGVGIGTFTSELIDLASQTTYYVRAYAVNSVGVSYGEEISFVTLADEIEEEVEIVTETIDVNGVTFTMIFVEGGIFEMGAQNSDPNKPNYDEEAWDREGPVHLVTLSDYYIGEIWDQYDRSALCQMGELHYLFVVCNRESYHWDLPKTLEEFQQRLVEFGCEMAYTLDGGQTATIVMNDKLINRVVYDSERDITDIIYFATALPNGG